MYEFREDGIFNFSRRDGEENQLTNFLLEITKEIRYHDGKKVETFLTITGKIKGENGLEELPPATIHADKFPSFSWVAQHWGMRPVIMPVPNAEREIRTAVQLRSTPEVQDVYTHTGWTKIDGRPVYLHSGGGIAHDGPHPEIIVELPNELANYELPPPPTGNNAARAAKASLNLTELGPPHIVWPLYAATYRAAIGPADFALHLAGKTGTFKSEISSLFQSHYGVGMDSRHLPGSWSSTGNALEAQAYRTKNALFTIDDFVPYGTAWQVRALQKTADQLIRGQGNQSGRARLTDVSSMQTTMFPRGVILSTGEDVPEGHSVRARMLILDLSPGDIPPKALSASQAARELYPAAMAAFVKWLAKRGPEATWRDLKALSNTLRDSLLDIGHSRTPSMLGDLIATVQIIMLWLTEIGAVTEGQADSLSNAAAEAIVAAGNRQIEHLEGSDPTEAFVDALRQILTLQQGHFRSLTGGIPQQPTLLGWTAEASAGDVPNYKSHGTKMGWVNWDQDEMYIDVTASMQLIRKTAAGKITITKNTLLKRLKDAGLLVRTDETRKRNTVRVTAEGHPRNVLILSLSQTLDTGGERP